MLTTSAFILLSTVLLASISCEDGTSSWPELAGPADFRMNGDDNNNNNVRRSVSSSASSALIEFTNSSGAVVHCHNRRTSVSSRSSSSDAPSAFPSSSITWLDANRQPILSVPGLRHVLTNGTMVFPPYAGDAHRKDIHTTEYRCLTTTALSAVLSPIITVRSAVIGALQVYASDARSSVGGTAVLVCLVLPSDQRWAVDVTHWTAGQHHLVDSHQVPQNGAKYVVIDGNLHVAQVTADDAQLTYRCSARHRLSQRSATSPPARILLAEAKELGPITTTSPILPPGVVHVHGQLGQESIYMWCNLRFNQKIRWFKLAATRNGAAVALVPDGRRIIAGGDWLQVRQLTEEDAGRYKCQAGQVELEFLLDVHQAQLSAVLEPHRQVAGVNQPVEFMCNVSGSAVSAGRMIRWTRNGLDVPLAEPSSPGRYYLPLPHVLRINQALPADSGMYQCFVSSQAASGSEAEASAELVVHDYSARLTNVFNEQTVHLGRSVYLHCFASANPAPSVIWTVDSYIVPYTSGRVSVWSHQVDDNSVRSYLNISSTEVEDGGLYCCSVQGSSATQHCARLNVYGPASIRWTANRTAIAGQDFFLHCPYAGYPVISTTWFRNNQVLRETGKYKLFTNGTLRIFAMEPSSDSGEYTCAVKGTASSMAERALYIEVIRAPVIEPFSFPTQVQDGGRAQVTCSISAGDLPIQISWLKDGRPIADRLNVETQSGEFHSLLIFKKLRGEHSGTYTCTARNLAAPASHSATLLVQVPPKWVVEPQDVALLEHLPAKILCQAHGMPAPSITWFRVEGDNRQQIHPTSKANVQKDGSLVFNNIAKSEEGLLACRAGNNIGSPLAKTIRITVHAAARVRVKTGGTTLPTGSEAIFRCEATGDPPLTTYWIKNDQIVDGAGRFRLNPSPSGVDLIINQTETADSGVYVCLAANIYGSDASEIKLVIQELPGAPSQLQFTSIQSRSAELQWSDDHHVDVQFRIHLSRPQQSGWSLNYTVESGRSVMTLPHLQPFTVYQVQVNAINSAGTGPPSTPLEFQTLEEVPSGAPRHVQAEPKSSRSLLVSWLPPNEETWNGPLVTFMVTCVGKGSSQAVQQRSIPALASGMPNLSGGILRRFQVIVEDLIPATLYAVTVRVLNRMGVGPESDPVSIMMPEAAPSAAPVNINCAALFSDAIQITWSHPALSELHGHLQGFRIFYKVVRTVTDSVSIRAESKRVGNTLDSVLYGLQAYHNYSIQVSAINRAGNGPLSAPVICQTDENVAATVQDLKVLSLSGSALQVIWRHPVPPSGRVSHYTILLKDTVTQESKTFVQHDPDGTTFTIGHLVENRLYEVSLITGSRAGESRPSRVVTVAPLAKSGVKILEFSRNVYVEEQSAVTLQCPVAGTLPIQRSWSFVGQPLDASQWDKDGAIHLSSVTKSDEGEYACTARNAHGRDSVIYTLHLLRVPEAPQLSVTPTSVSSIRLSWNKPHSISRLAILEYLIFYRPVQHSVEPGNMLEKAVDGSEDATLLDGLLCGTQYELQIQARNQIGTGPKSPILRAMTRGAGPTLPSESDIIGFSPSLPATLFLHLDRWPTGGCRISYMQIEKRGPLSLLGTDPSSENNGGWNALASNLNPDQQPMLKISDLMLDEVYQLRLTATSDAGLQTVAYSIRRISIKNVETGSFFEVLPLASSTAHHISYESMIVIGSMSVSGLMLLFSLAAISYVIHKRKQYRAKAASASAVSTKSEYSLRTVAEQLDNDHRVGRSLPRINNRGSNYSLRKDNIDYDDDDITPYATFTLKPICGMDTTRSLTSYPPRPDSHSPNSIDADYGQHCQHPTLPQHYNRQLLNRSPVPPYRPSSSDGVVTSNDSSVYSDTFANNKKRLVQQLQQHHQHRNSSNQRTMAEVLRPPPHLSEFQHHRHDDVNKLRF